MKDTFYRSVIFDASDGAEQYFIFPRLQNYESVEITFEWSDVDETLGGTIVMQEGINGIWVNIPDLETALDTDEGTGALQHTDFGNKDIKVLVNFAGESDVDIDVDVDVDADADVSYTGIIVMHLIAKMR